MTTRRLGILSLSISLGLGALACEEPAATPAPEPAPASRYSPFVLRMSQPELPFSEISFKDVGMSVAPEHRHLVYEEVAQSLAYELAQHEALPMSSEVLYSEAAADPSSHVACGERHIYVDLWASEAPQRWGYSLWSGCAEEDRFGWRELSRADPEEVDDLTRDIAGALRQAVARRCFTQRC